MVGAGQGDDAQRVGLPPPAQCIEWLQAIDQQYAAELLLKLELLDGIDICNVDGEALDLRAFAANEDLVREYLPPPDVEP